MAALLLAVLGSAPLSAQSADGGSSQRILGVIPNYQTVDDPNGDVAPLTPKQKWKLFYQETVDPFNGASAAFGAVFSQMGDDNPKYGRGGGAFSERFGAAVADFGTQNLFSAGVLACLLHQDPRYFRKGPQFGILSRVVYSVSRLVITRQDSGAAAPNFSGLGGMALGIGASNLYYPSASINGSVVIGRFGTSLMGGAIGNLMAEFWPDIRDRVLHHRHHSTEPGTP